LLLETGSDFRHVHALIVKRKTIPFLFKLLVSGVLILLISKIIDFSEVREIAGNAYPGLLILAAFYFALSNILGALQWYVLMNALGLDVSLTSSVSHYFVGLFFNNFFPSSMGGDPVKYTEL